MKKEKINDLKNSSRLLIIVSGIMLFLIVAFVSYSIFGNGKGTYGAEQCSYKMPGTIEYNCSSSEYLVSGNRCCPLSSVYSTSDNKCVGCSGIVFSDGSCSKPVDNSITYNPTTPGKECSISGYVAVDNKYCCPSSDYKVVDIYWAAAGGVVPSCVPKNVTCSNTGSGGGTTNKCYKCTLSGGEIKYTWSPTAMSGCSAQESITSESDCLAKNSTTNNCTYSYVNSNKVDEIDIVTTDSGCDCPSGWSKTSSGSQLICYKSATKIGTGYKYDIPSVSGISGCTTESFSGKKYSKNGNTCVICTSGSYSSGTCTETGSSGGNKCYKCTLSGGEIKYTWSPTAMSGCSAQESITSESACLAKNSTTTDKCFKCTLSNGKIEYTWSPTAMSGCSAQESITSESACLAKNSTTTDNCTYEIKGGTGGTVNTGVSGCNGKVSYTGKKNLSDLEKCVSNSGKCIDNWTVKFENGTTKTYSYNINSADNDCGITLTPNWGACSSGGTPGGSSSETPGGSSDESSGGTTTEAEYSENYNDDRCYNGEWVRVDVCQPKTVTNAKCKLTDGTKVDRNTVLNGRSGCDLLGNAYDKVINDYRCNKVTGKWIYITSCQSGSTIGAHCKYTSGTVILTDLTNGAHCSDDKPSTSSGNGDKTQQDIDSNVQTGTIEVIIAWVVGIVALCVSFYYFRKNKATK